VRVSFFIFLIWLFNVFVTYLVNKWKINPRYKFLISYSLFVVFIPLFKAVFSPFVNPSDFHQTLHFHLIIFFSINTVIFIIQDLILTRERNTAIGLENAQLKMKNLEAINAQLKQQIHPHFLFNSLSTLKTLIASSPENAQEYLVKLSDLLRSSLSSNTLNTIKVEDELKSCIDYLEMQQIRFAEAFQFVINIPEDIRQNCWLPVFSLQILIENAIKHNAFTNEQPLHISISYNASTITVTNNIQHKTLAEASAGTGLSNLSERYKILSGEDIAVKKEDEVFSVSIKVFNDENCNYRR
jgi:two-component system, LytTR family, sensor kinase